MKAGGGTGVPLFSLLLSLIHERYLHLMGTQKKS